MSASYIPSNDMEYKAWVERFVNYLSEHTAHFGLTPVQIAPLQSTTLDTVAAITGWEDAKNAAKQAVALRNTERTGNEILVRAMVGLIQACPATTDVDREGLGIPVRGSGTSTSGVELSDDKPTAIIDIRPHLKHIIRIQNQTPTGTKKARPDGAVGCEIYRKVGEAPESTSDMTYVGLATRSPYAVEFAVEDGNKPAHYRFRWVGPKGQKGEWSDLETATVAA